jgi:predicted nucleic acid-binding protein
MAQLQVAEPSWGGLALVVDTSAWMRASRPPVVDRWTSALRADRLRLSPAVRLEILFTARDGDRFDLLLEALSIVRPSPLTRSVLTAAEAGMRALAHRSAGSHRLPVIDYLLAASAQETGAAVLHYDHDYDTLAEVMDFESVWLARPGSVH